MAEITDIRSVFNTDKPCTQREFAALIGVSEAAVSGMVSRGVISSGQTLGEWLMRYCAHIREQAAGRATNGELDLATERAALAREQRIRINLQNAVTLRNLAPIAVMEADLADLLARVGKQLDTIPAKLRVKSDKLSADDLDTVSSVLAAVRNEIAGWNVDWFGESAVDSEFVMAGDESDDGRLD